MAHWSCSAKLRRPLKSLFPSFGPTVNSWMQAAVTVAGWPKRSSKLARISLYGHPADLATTSHASPVTNFGRNSICWTSVNKPSFKLSRILLLKTGKSAALQLNFTGCIAWSVVTLNKTACVEFMPNGGGNSTALGFNGLVSCWQLATQVAVCSCFGRWGSRENLGSHSYFTTEFS